MQGKDSNHSNQRGEILALLSKEPGARVPLPEILALGIAQYGSRIFELRRAGFVIVNERERVNGELHTWFRLLSGPRKLSDQEFTPSKSDTRGALDGETSSETLFPIGPTDRTYLE